jgi:hypothetical protein
VVVSDFFKEIRYIGSLKLQLEDHMTVNKKTMDDRLSEHPHLRARMEEILDIVEGKNNGPDTADSVEERTLIEVRKLSQEVMKDWAKNKAKTEVSSYQLNHPKAKFNKKKVQLEHNLWKD